MSRVKTLVVLGVVLVLLAHTCPLQAQRSKRSRSKSADPQKQLRREDLKINSQIAQLRGNQLQRVFETGSLATDEQRQALRQLCDLHLQRMTLPYNYQSDRLSRTVVSALLNELRTLGEQNNPDAHDLAVRHLLSRLPQMVRDEKLPVVVRLNAALLIGELNQQEPSATQPGVPLPQATGVLLDLVEDEKMPWVYRLAALRGLVRHAASGVVQDPQVQARLQQTALKLLLLPQDEKQTLSEDLRTWIRSRAAKILGSLRRPRLHGQPLDQPPVVLTQLLQVARNSQEPLLLRVAALQAVGRMPLEQVQNLDLKLLAHTIVQTAYDAITRKAPLEPMLPQIRAEVIQLLLLFQGPEGQGGVMAMARDEQTRKVLDEAAKGLQRVAQLLMRRPPRPRRRTNPENQVIDDTQEEEPEDPRTQFFKKLATDLAAEAEALKAWLEKNPIQPPAAQAAQSPQNSTAQ